MQLGTHGVSDTHCSGSLARTPQPRPPQLHPARGMLLPLPGHAWPPRGCLAPRPAGAALWRRAASLGPQEMPGPGRRSRGAGQGRTGQGKAGQPHSPSCRRYLSLGEIELAGELGALPPHDVLAALKLHLQAVELLGREGGAGPLGTVQIKPLRQNNLSD